MIAVFAKRLIAKLMNKEYRDAYVAENVRTGVAYQIRALREQRDLSQFDLGKLMGKPQSVISRLEDPDYGKLTVQTLLEVASSLDVALVVQFATHADFLRRMHDVSPNALMADSFSEEQLKKSTTEDYLENMYVIATESPSLLEIRRESNDDFIFSSISKNSEQILRH